MNKQEIIFLLHARNHCNNDSVFLERIQQLNDVHSISSESLEIVKRIIDSENEII